MTHVDQNIDWFAHARERKRAFELKTQQAARALAEKKALPPPPPIQEIVAVDPPAPRPLAKLIDYRPAWRIIAQQVCEKHKISLTELQGGRRFQRLSVARREIFWRLRHELKMSLLDSARKMGKDHTTVLHGLRIYARDNLPTGEKECITKTS